MGIILKNVIIPSTIDGKNIVGIGKGAFQHCITIEYLRISEGIRYIEDGAFFDCSALKSCLLPQSLVRLGSELNTLPNPTGVFEHTALEHIILPEAIRYIENGIQKLLKIKECPRFYQV